MSGAVRFSEERLAEIERLSRRYPGRRSLLLPVLHMAQQDFGHLSEDVQRMVAEVVGVPIMWVKEVVTFYTMFRPQPCGKYLVEFCTNASCMVNGAYELMQTMCEKLGIQPGQTTPDGLFTVKEVECLGACAGAPVVQVNHGPYRERADEAFVEELIARAKEEGA